MQQDENIMLLVESMVSGDVVDASSGETTGSAVHTSPDKLTPLQRRKKRKLEETTENKPEE